MHLNQQNSQLKSLTNLKVTHIPYLGHCFADLNDSAVKCCSSHIRALNFPYFPNKNSRF